LRGCAVIALGVIAGCIAPAPETSILLTYSGSAVGAEGDVLRDQLERFSRFRPDIRVDIVATPDSADHRHQLYVQWLNARAAAPDVLQLDVIWTPEFAAAGWLAPIDAPASDVEEFFDASIQANRWDGRLYAIPLFVDVGMLYWRTDLFERAPRTLDELATSARQAVNRGDVPYGYVWQGARYEGLVTVFIEHLVGYGGAIVDGSGRVALDSEAAVQALAFLRAAVADGGISPRAVVGWQEEQTRFAFQNGRAAFMRNWPYAYPLMQDEASSRIVGRFAVAPMPAAPGGEPAAALGGAQLAINARSRHPAEARALIEYLTAPEQMIERARRAGQYPPRRRLYESGALRDALAIPPEDARAIIERATPRPVTPLYTELSSALQVSVHRSLSGQSAPAEAISAAARDVRRIVSAAEREPRHDWTGSIVIALALAAVAGGSAALALRRRRNKRPTPDPFPGEAWFAWLWVSPAIALIAIVALFPVAWALWESLFLHDLRMPWRGRPFVGFGNYAELAGDSRFWAALGHTAVFTVVSVSFELGLGMAAALIMRRLRSLRGAVRTLVLLPWAIPTVVAALIWQFAFSERGAVNALLVDTGAVDAGIGWLVDATLAWVPLILADVWKTTPFVALLLLAGMQGIDEELYDAARTDGAGSWQAFVHITLPLLRPAVLLVLVFRSLDAFRVFDLIYVLTGGGPGTATESISIHAFTSLLQNLRFGYGSAVAVVTFAISCGLAALFVRLLGRELTKDREP
jgi:ABC-type sugar transport system permease subunit/ABC-type glycerol-3-phosphate transport system substrate-binding protein